MHDQGVASSNNRWLQLSFIYSATVTNHPCFDNVESPWCTSKNNPKNNLQHQRAYNENHSTPHTIYFPDQLASSGAHLIQLGLICFNSTKATVISLLQPCFGCHVMPTPINIDICLHCLWLSSSFLSSQFISLFQHKS